MAAAAGDNAALELAAPPVPPAPPAPPTPAPPPQSPPLEPRLFVMASSLALLTSSPSAGNETAETPGPAVVATLHGFFIAQYLHQ